MPTNTKQQLCIKPTGFLVVNKAAEASSTCLSLGDNMSILALQAHLEFLFFLEKCDNTDTENIKLIVLTFM